MWREPVHVPKIMKTHLKREDAEACAQAPWTFAINVLGLCMCAFPLSQVRLYALFPNCTLPPHFASMFAKRKSSDRCCSFWYSFFFCVVEPFLQGVPTISLLRKLLALGLKFCISVAFLLLMPVSKPPSLQVGSGFRCSFPQNNLPGPPISACL